MVKVNYGIKERVKRFFFNINDFKEIYHRFETVEIEGYEIKDDSLENTEAIKDINEY